MDEGLKYLLFLILVIIPAILLLGSYVFGSRIGDEIFSIKYLKGTFDCFKTLIILYFSAIFFIIIFFYFLKKYINFNDL